MMASFSGFGFCCCPKCEGHQGETVAGIVTTEEFKDGCLVLIGDSANFIGGNLIDATSNDDFFDGAFSRVNGSVLCLGSASDWPVEAGSQFEPTGTYVPGTTDIDTVG